MIALFVNLTITFTTSLKDKEYAMDLFISSFPLRAQKNHGQIFPSIFIGPESDHWQCLLVTHSLTHSCLVNLMHVTLACEDANSKLVVVVTVADEDRVGNNLL